MLFRNVRFGYFNTSTCGTFRNTDRVQYAHDEVSSNDCLCGRDASRATGLGSSFRRAVRRPEVRQAVGNGEELPVDESALLDTGSSTGPA